MTRCQQQCLAFLEAFMAVNGGVSPSFVEIKTELKLKSTSSISRLLNALEDQGRIIRGRYRHRDIRLIPTAEARLRKALESAPHPWDFIGAKTYAAWYNTDRAEALG